MNGYIPFLGRGQLEGVPSKSIIVWVDALTDEPTEEIRGLIITAARRSKFKKSEGTEKAAFSWQRIKPGDYFLIRYNEIKNLNITYRDVRDPIPAFVRQM